VRAPIDTNVSPSTGAPTGSPSAGSNPTWTRADLVAYMQQTGVNNPDMAAIQLNNYLSKGGTLSSFTSPPTAPDTTNTAPPMDNGITVIGSGPGSAGYDQMAANFMNSSTAANQLGAGGGGGGGGGGASGGFGGISGSGSGTNSLGGLLSGGNGLGSVSQGGSIGFPNMPSPSSLNYQFPQGGTNINGGAGLSSVAMQPANAQQGLNQYMNTPGYQLLFSNQNNQYQQSPGYQYAVDQAMQQVQRNAAAKGLLASIIVL